MRATIRTLCTLAVIVLTIVASERVGVTDDEIARPASAAAQEKLTAGTRLYRLQEFQKAIEEYKAGALMEDAAVFYYNLGQCYRQLGEYEKAIWHYQRFLDRAKPVPAKYKTAAEGFIKDMKAELEKKAMTSQPTEPAPDPRPTGAATESTQSATNAPQIVTVVQPTEPWYADGLGWGLAGTGGIASTISIYLLLDAKSLEDDANRESSQVTQAALRDRAGDRRLAGAIIGVAGAAALVTGIVKLAITPSAQERTATSSLDFGVTRNGFAVVGRF